MMSSFTKSSKSSGICIYCNTFFHRLASHMLSSETCELASQESLCHETIQCDNSVLEAIAKDGSISDKTQLIAKDIA